jgi:hypothetical protein
MIRKSKNYKSAKSWGKKDEDKMHILILLCIVAEIQNISCEEDNSSNRSLNIFKNIKRNILERSYC